MKKLTKRQEQVFNFILSQIQKKGYPPSIREIAESLNLSSSSTAYVHLSSLEKKGFLKRERFKPRALEVINLHDAPILTSLKIKKIPLVGKISAGKPVLAQENIEEFFFLPANFVKKENLFILKVKGDSMIEAGLFENDYLVFEQKNYAENGDIVAALIDDEVTVKKFFKEKDYIRLQPANKLYEPIRVKEVTILGKAIFLFRTL